MFVNRINVVREGYYSYGSNGDPSKPLKATVEVAGANCKTEINLGPEASQRIVALIAEELAASARAVAEVMTADFITAQPSLPAK